MTTPMRRVAPAETSNRQDMDRARRTEADNVRHADLRIRDLPLLRATVLRQMPHDLADVRDAGRAQRMALREQSARYIDRPLAAEVRMDSAALVDKLACLAVAAEPEVLVMHQLGRREAVMQFREAHVSRSDPRHLVRLLGCAPRERADIAQREIALRIRVGGEHRCRHLCTLPSARELLQLVLADENRACGAVARRAA